MATLLFCLQIIATIGLVFIPLTNKTRGMAVLGWFGEWFAIGGFKYCRTEWFPQWQQPAWSTSPIWMFVTLTLIVLGLIIALMKPRKRNTKVA